MQINQKYQQQNSLLMEIAVLAKDTPDLIDLSIGDLDVTTNESIIAAAFAAAKNGETKYTAPDGTKTFLGAVCRYYKKRYHMTISENEVRATVGAMHGMYLALMALVDKGDEVIIHEPYFTPYKEQVLACQGIPVFVATNPAENYQLDVEKLAEKITDKTKIIIINSPNNPTGAVFTKETMQKIADLAIANNLYIFSDEVYEAYCFNENFTPMMSYAPQNTITFNSFSKTFAMTGWRIGFMIAPEQIIDACRNVSEFVTFTAPSISQAAGVFALDNWEELFSEVASLVYDRLRYIEKRVGKINFLSMGEVSGSLYAYLDISKTNLDSLTFVKKVLAECHVLLVPGVAFGETTGKDQVRIAANQPVSILKSAFDRLAKLTFS